MWKRLSKGPKDKIIGFGPNEIQFRVLKIKQDVEMLGGISKDLFMNGPRFDVASPGA